MANYRQAGRISGNPLCGLNERICVEVKRVFDGCQRRFSGESFTFAVQNTESFTQPFSFVEARQNGNTVISNLVATALDNGRTRFTFVTSVPLSVTFTDANGVTGVGSAELIIPREVTFRTPGEAVVPYALEATTGVYANIGTFNGSVATVTVCALQIVRLTATVELLLPSYGYCEYPECSDDGENSCRGLFELPLFPT